MDHQDPRADKLESIISGHEINPDDADWLRALTASVPAQPADAAVRVCPERDIDCGERPANWCSDCPKRLQAVAAHPLSTNCVVDHEARSMNDKASVPAQPVAPFGWLADDGGSMRAFFRASERNELDDLIAESQPDQVIPLYAAHVSQEVAPAKPLPNDLDPAMPPYWQVEVIADGESLVSIGHNWLSGSRALEQADERTIIGAAKHLLAFVGYGLPESSFDPDDDQEVAPQFWRVPGESYCLVCKKLGHFTTDCNSTHGLNTPEGRELSRLCGAAHAAQAVAQPVAPAGELVSEALLHAGKCRSWAAKTFNDTPDMALCVGAGDRLLYAAQLLDALALAAAPTLPQAAAQEAPTDPVFRDMPNPTPMDLVDPLFEAIWQATKTWDVNAPEHYNGYCGLNGSHVMLILQKVRAAIAAQEAPAAEEVVLTKAEFKEYTDHIAELERALQGSGEFHEEMGDQLAQALRDECADAVEFGDGRLNTSRILEIIDRTPGGCGACPNNPGNYPATPTAQEAPKA